MLCSGATVQGTGGCRRPAAQPGRVSASIPYVPFTWVNITHTHTHTHTHTRRYAHDHTLYIHTQSTIDTHWADSVDFISRWEGSRVVLSFWQDKKLFPPLIFLCLQKGDNPPTEWRPLYEMQMKAEGLIEQKKRLETSLWGEKVHLFGPNWYVCWIGWYRPDVCGMYRLTHAFTASCMLCSIACPVHSISCHPEQAEEGPQFPWRHICF